MAKLRVNHNKTNPTQLNFALTMCSAVILLVAVCALHRQIAVCDAQSSSDDSNNNSGNNNGNNNNNNGQQSSSNSGGGSAASSSSNPEAAIVVEAVGLKNAIKDEVKSAMHKLRQLRRRPQTGGGGGDGNRQQLAVTGYVLDKVLSFSNYLDLAARVLNTTTTQLKVSIGNETGLAVGSNGNTNNNGNNSNNNNNNNSGDSSQQRAESVVSEETAAAVVEEPQPSAAAAPSVIRRTPFGK